MVQCNARLTADLYGKLEARAHRDKSTKSAVVVAALEAYLKGTK